MLTSVAIRRPPLSLGELTKPRYSCCHGDEPKSRGTESSLSEIRPDWQGSVPLPSVCCSHGNSNWNIFCDEFEEKIKGNRETKSLRSERGLQDFSFLLQGQIKGSPSPSVTHDTLRTGLDQKQRACNYHNITDKSRSCHCFQ